VFHCKVLSNFGEKLAKMLGKSPNQSQKNLFSPVLKEIINPQESLVLLADRIP